MNLETYHQFVQSLAYRAGRLTLSYFNKGIRPEFKSDHTPVTAADRAAEGYIRGEIEKTFPDHVILGEEYGGAQETGAPFRWIIDPIDGTKSFMRGVPLYSVLIALEIDGQVEVGAAYFPGLDEMLSAARGLGCWWNGRRTRVSEVASMSQACVCYTSYHGFAQRDPGVWQRFSDSAYMLRGWSDAYGYMAVATGRAEVMLDPAIQVWDIGPYPIIFSEAGGFFGSWAGVQGLGGHDALACNHALLDEVLRLIQG